MSRDDSGSAFPYTQHYSERGNDWVETVEGMTLRDYFAAKAMQGYFSLPRDMEKGIDRAAVAQFAYEIADAMLTAGGEK